MKHTLIDNFRAGIRDRSEGEGYREIVGYFMPEYVTALVLFVLTNGIDAAFVAQLKSTSLYATQGISSTLLHFVIKIAEGLSVGTVILCGQYNGAGHYRGVGRVLASAFWITTLIGVVLSGTLFCGAHAIYRCYAISDGMADAGATFLRLRVVGVFFAFVYFALIGFLRGIKNTRAPMYFFMLGAAVFVFFDYVLIFGKFGFPEMKLQGSALAGVLQYGVMLIAALIYSLAGKDTRIYSIDLLHSWDMAHMYGILRLSWPVMIDKAVLALSKIWLAMLIAPMGKVALASFAAIKDMEQFAIIPAVALGQVVTFLVSNNYGMKNWIGIKNALKRTLLLASLCTSAILLLFALYPWPVLAWFDTQGTFTTFAAPAFTVLSVLVICDLLQLILAGALRGATQVRTVMWIRTVTVVGFFMPVSYGLTLLPLENILLKFILVYSTFYIATGLMALMYVRYMRRDTWRQQPESGTPHDRPLEKRYSSPRPHGQSERLG